MNEIVTVLDLIKQMILYVPCIIIETIFIAGMINCIFDIQNNNIKHIISWIVAVISTIGICACGGMIFGFGGWDYILAAAVGLVIGCASNGIYDWPVISNIIDKFYEWFCYIQQKLLNKVKS